MTKLLVTLTIIPFLLTSNAYAERTYPIAYFDGTTAPGAFDLNNDGKNEEFLIDATECGSGGCTLIIKDPVTQKKVGDLFGDTVFVYPPLVNKWSALGIYMRDGLAGGEYSTYVFDGKRYMLASTVYLTGDSWQRLLESRAKLKKIG